MSNKTKKRKKGLLATGYRNSLIISTATSLSARLHKAVSGSVVARFFCNNEKLENSKSNSFMHRAFASSGITQLFSKIKTSFARMVESSAIVAAYRRFVSALICSYVRDLGIFFLSFGLFSLSAILLRVFMFDSPGKTPDGDVICTVCMLIGAIPLLPSKKSIAKKISGSAILSSLLNDVLGVSPLALKTASNPRSHGPVALVSGTVLGALSYIFSPVQILLILMFCVLSMLLMYSPESGFMLSLAMVPFTPYSVLRTVIIAASVSYFLKLLRGKRNISFNTADISVMLFSVATACAIGPGSLPMPFSGCLIYSLAVNLIRNTDLLENGIAALSLGLALNAFATTAVSVFALVGINAADHVPMLALVDKDFSITLSLVSIPISLLMFHGSKSPVRSAFALCFYAAITVNAVLSFSLPIWLGYAVITVIYGIQRSGKAVNVLLYTALIAPFAATLMLKIAQVNNVLPFSMPSLFKHSHWSMLLFGGASPTQDESILTAIVSSGGILLLVMLTLTLLCVISKTSYAIQKSRLDSVRTVCGSLIAAIPALMYTLAMPETYGDMRIILMFFCTIGLVSCSGNVFTRRFAAEDY